MLERDVTESEQREFGRLLDGLIPRVGHQQIDLIVRFRGIVVEENRVQNLTRLLSPQEFFEGHVLDSIELLKSGFLDEVPSIDVGSGVGVPGIITSILDGSSWVLVESELRKTEFLKKAVEVLGLGQCSVRRGRIEGICSSLPQSNFVARAVGPIGRIYPWIRDCSTWNSLILLKGPGWEVEWAEFQEKTKKIPLKIVDTHKYSVGTPNKQRAIVRLERI